MKKNGKWWVDSQWPAFLRCARMMTLHECCFTLECQDIVPEINCHGSFTDESVDSQFQVTHRYFLQMRYDVITQSITVNTNVVNVRDPTSFKHRRSFYAVMCANTVKKGSSAQVPFVLYGYGLPGKWMPYKIRSKYIYWNVLTISTKEVGQNIGSSLINQAISLNNWLLSCFSP